jgi:hypothetical protein
MKITALSIGTLAIGCALASPAFAASYTTFTVPGATTTWPTVIDSNGDVAGFYVTTNGQGAFVRTSDGTITTFNVPGATGTNVQGINDQGTISGTWGSQSDGDFPHGFYRTAAGVFTTFDPPGSVGTQSALISNNGSIAGGYYTSNPGPLLGYVMAPDGAFTTFTIPGVESNGTVAAINSNGDLAGTLGPKFLFLRLSDGTIETKELNGAVDSPAVKGRSEATYVFGVNISDEVVGTDGIEYDSLTLDGNVYENFLWANGSISLFLPSYNNNPNYATGINDSGQICGFVNGYGYLHNADGGTSVFQVDSLPTYPYGINNSGVITGTAGDIYGASPSSSGFVGTP